MGSKRLEHNARVQLFPSPGDVSGRLVCPRAFVSGSMLGHIRRYLASTATWTNHGVPRHRRPGVGLPGGTSPTRRSRSRHSAPKRTHFAVNAGRNAGESSGGTLRPFGASYFYERVTKTSFAVAQRRRTTSSSSCDATRPLPRCAAEWKTARVLRRSLHSERRGIGPAVMEMCARRRAKAPIAIVWMHCRGPRCRPNIDSRMTGACVFRQA